MRKYLLLYVLVAIIFLSFTGMRTGSTQTSATTEEDKNITLQLVDTDIKSAIQMVAMCSGTNIVVCEGVQGNITLNLQDVPLEQALQLIVESKGYSWRKEGNVYIVSPEPPKKLPPALLPLEPPEKEQPIAEKPEEIIVDKFRCNYVNAVDIALMFGGSSAETNQPRYNIFGNMATPAPEELQVGQRFPGYESPLRSPGYSTLGQLQRNPFSLQAAAVGRPLVTAPGVPGITGLPGAAPAVGAVGVAGIQLLPAGMSAPVAYPPDNSLIIRGTPSQISEFKQVLTLIDVPRKQVTIEALFVEMTVSEAEGLGIDWSITGTNPAITVGQMQPGGYVSLRYAIGNFNALLTTLKMSTKAKLTNAPRMRTMNNEPATLMFTTLRPYFNVQVIVTPVGGVTTVRYPDFIPVMTGLVIYPRIMGGDLPPWFVDVYITPQLSDITGFVSGPSGEQIPIISTKSLQAHLQVRDGDTIVIGGMIRKDESKTVTKVPLLGELPVIGSLFRGTSVSYADNEILIFLTPHVSVLDTTGVAIPGSSVETAPAPPS